MAKAHSVPTRSVFVVFGLCLATMTSPLQATNYYVKTNGSDSATGLSWAAAFATIGKAITVSINGDVVDVNVGTYTERLNYSGKRIHIRSTDPNDAATVAATVINANSTTLNAVTFSSGENASAVLEGFTVRNGKYGVYCTSSSSPTISKCVVRNNSNCGLYTSSGSSPAINDCQVLQNSGTGIYLYGGSAQIRRCRVLSNSYNGIYGAVSYTGTIQNCIIAKNTNYGINLYQAASTAITNCTIVSNVAGGISGTCGQIKNCIVWGNGDDLAYTGCTPTYCCIEDQDTGTGVIHSHPMLADLTNDDYHLWYSSPCINAGDPASSYANEPNGGGGRIDLGAYGNTAEATTLVDEDSDGLADAWETTYWPGQDPNLHGPNDDPDGDGLRNKDEYYVHWDPNTNNSGSIIGLVHSERLDINLPSISLALSTAANNDVLTMAATTFVERINFNGKPLRLRSSDPNNASIVAATVINGNSTSLDTVTFNTGETATSILDGITVRGGRHGINCASSSSPTLSKCVIRNNSTYGVYVSSLAPALRDCQITQNGSYGLYINGTGTSCEVTGTAILANSSYGVRCLNGRVTLDNCVIARNSLIGVDLDGGDSGQSSVTNCTIYNNSSGGIHTIRIGVFGNVKNCIVWGNGDDLQSCTATYSCIEDQDAGMGVIHSHPTFVDSANDDYHLWYSSPCIDAGDPCSVYVNEPNGGGGRVDMGAYGNTAEATTIVDEDADGLADAWEATYWPGQDPNLHGPNDDPDNDGLRNKDEYYVHWDPNSDDSAHFEGRVHNTRLDVNFPSLALAFSTADNGDTLIAEPNTFHETIRFNGKPVCLRSMDPNDPNVVGATVVDASNTSLDVVTFNTAEGENSALDGVTVRGGKYGIYCSSASPTLTRCIIRNNADSGMYCAGTSAPVIDGGRIIDNSGYGLYLTNGSRTISGLHIVGNHSHGVYLQSYSGTLKNCVIAKNLGRGVNLNQSPSAKVISCTVAGNSQYGIVGTCAQVTNCIVWNNGDDLSSCTATYSCIQDGDSGLGNISGDPCFVNVDANDFHLSTSSVCIDAGEPWAAYANEPSPNGGRIDLGAYGNTAEATPTTDVDSDGIADSWERYFWPGDDPNQHGPNDDSDGDYFTNLSEFLYGYNPTQFTNQPMSIIHPALSTSPFEPTQGQTFTVAYWLNRAGDVNTSFAETATGEVVRVLHRVGAVGLNQDLWNGRDANELIVLHGTYTIAIDANDGAGHSAHNAPGTAGLTYVHDITDLRINPIRVIATSDEVTRITYNINVNANMMVEVFDPCSVCYSVPLNDVAQTQGAQELLWYGCTKTPGDPDNNYPSREGEYNVRVRFSGMRENEEASVWVFN